MFGWMFKRSRQARQIKALVEGYEGGVFQCVAELRKIADLLQREPVIGDRHAYVLAWLERVDLFLCKLSEIAPPEDLRKHGGAIRRNGAPFPQIGLTRFASVDALYGRTHDPLRSDLRSPPRLWRVDRRGRLRPIRALTGAGSVLTHGAD